MSGIQTSGNTTLISSIATTTNGAVTYSSGQNIGTGFLKFNNVFRAGAYSCLIQGIYITFKSAQTTGTINVHFFSSAPTGTYTDNTTFNLTAGDKSIWLGFGPVSSFAAFGSGGSGAELLQFAFPYYGVAQFAAGAQSSNVWGTSNVPSTSPSSIYALLVAASAFTLQSNDIAMFIATISD